MNTSGLRLYIINGSAVGVVNFSQIEDWLKIILLIVTIGYTVAKWSKIKDEENTFFNSRRFIGGWIQPYRNSG